MTQQEFNEMLAVAIAGGLGGGTYISRWDGEEIDNAIALVRESGLAYLANGNLLINSDFRQPVNRNGKTEYTGAGYAIDGWKGSNTSFQLQLESDGIRLTKTGAIACIFLQNIPQSRIPNGIYTLSALIDGELQAVTFELAPGMQSVASQPFSNGWVVRIENAQGLYYAPHIRSWTSTAAESVLCVAAKLELGDQQTLAHQDEDGSWVLNDPPNYDLQYLLTSLYSPTTGEWVGIQHSNPNLLDNAHFIGGGSQQGGGQFPINQRGLTEYTTGGYIIDRWCNRNNSLIKLESDGLRISSVDGNGTIKAFNQRFENYASLLGKTVTLSALIIENNVIGSDAALMVAGADNVLLNTNILISTPIAGKTGLVTVTAKIPATIDESGINIGIYIGRNGSSAVDLKIAAMKLELGPIQTLAHQDAAGNWILNDPPPKFGAELAECQRYQIFGMAVGLKTFDSENAQTYLFPTPVTMRSENSTLIGNLRGFISSGSEAIIPANNISSILVRNNGVYVTINGTIKYSAITLRQSDGFDNNI